MRRNNIFDEHTLDILKAAMPHVHPRAQGSMNVLLKANDLMTTIEHNGQDEEISTMELNNWKPEPEELLVSIKEVTNPGETEIVDTLLNFFKVRKLYNAYQTYSDNVLEAQGLGGGNRRNSFNPFSMFGMNQNMNQRGRQNQNRNAGNTRNANVAGNAGNAMGNNMNAAGGRGSGMGPNGGQMPNFLNFLMSQMSPEQKQTFDMLNMMMNNMPNNSGNVSGQNVNNNKTNGQKDTGGPKNNMKSQSLAEESTNDENNSKS